LGQISQAAWLAGRLKEAERLGIKQAFIPKPSGGRKEEKQSGALSLTVLTELEGLMRRIETFSRNRNSAAGSTNGTSRP